MNKLNIKYNDRFLHTIIIGNDSYKVLEKLFLKDFISEKEKPKKESKKQLFIVDNLERFYFLKSKGIKDIKFIENFTVNQTAYILDRCLNKNTKTVVFIPKDFQNDFFESINYWIFNPGYEKEDFFIYINSISKLDVEVYKDILLSGRGFNVSLNCSLENKDELSTSLNNLILSNIRNQILK